jgi:predicted permease
MLKDLRYACRMLVRSPLFTTVAGLSLALGIGGAAAVFTVLNAVVLRSLPIPNPQQLYLAEKHLPQSVTPRYSWTVFEQARDQMKGRAELFAVTNATSMNVRIAGRSDAAAAERGLVTLVSGEYFSVLRQHPQAGRLIEPSDNAPGANPVAVISDAYWERRFRRAADVVGREIIIGGTSLSIVGVTTPEFFGPFVAMRNPDVFVPLMLQPSIRYAFNASNSGNADPRKPWPPQPDIEWLHVFARVPQSADVPGVASALTAIHRRDASSRLDAPNSDGRRVDAETVVLSAANRGVSFLRGDLATTLYVLLAMVGVLLAITCGNVASLVVARASAREREIAIRSAIGASRWRVIRQLLIETVLLSAIGGGLGLLVAAWGADGLLAMFARTTTTVDLDTTFDWRVLGFALVITIASGLAAGIVPALRATRVTPTDALKTHARQVGAGGGRRGTFIGKTLVAAQIAFCLLLLIVAGLFVRSMQSLLRTDVGYDREHLLVARLDVRGLGYPNDQRQALYARVIDRLKSVPGVRSVSISMNGPLGTSERTSSLAVEGYTRGRDERLLTNEEIVTQGYFDTVGLSIVEGRNFTVADRQPGSGSSIVNQAMARRFFPNGDALGKRWTYGDPVDSDSPVIVGVVQDAKYVNIRGAVPNMIYRLSPSTPDEVLSNLEVRTAVAPSQLVSTVRQVLAEADPALPVYDIVPLEERLERGLTNDKLVANLTTAFGTIALVLAALGLYGTISYGVARRVTELGVRMALGANRSNVLWLVIGEALTLVAIGAAVGIPLAFAAGRSIGSMLHGVRPLDPMAYAAGAVALVVVASLAAFVPAHRASRIDPMVALRAE